MVTKMAMKMVIMMLPDIAVIMNGVIITTFVVWVIEMSLEFLLVDTVLDTLGLVLQVTQLLNLLSIALDLQNEELLLA